jgi:di/tripeptidase
MKFADKQMIVKNITLNEATRPRKENMVCIHLQVDISHKVQDNYAMKHNTKKLE